MHTTLVHMRVKPEHVEAFIEACRSEHDAALHKQTIHYATWRDTVADMMVESRRGVRMVGLLPQG